MPGDDPADDRQSFPTVKDRIGEDPARFLDVSVYTPDEESSPLSTALARIRGIDRLEVLAAWEAVERALGNERGDATREECPRKGILYPIEDRRRELEEHGERADQLEHRLDEADDVEKRTAYAVRDGERVPLEEAQRTAGEKSLGANGVAATDGGSDG